MLQIASHAVLPVIEDNTNVTKMLMEESPPGQYVWLDMRLLCRRELRIGQFDEDYIIPVSRFIA